MIKLTASAGVTLLKTQLPIMTKTVTKYISRENTRLSAIRFENNMNTIPPDKLIGSVSNIVIIPNNARIKHIKALLSISNSIIVLTKIKPKYKIYSCKGVFCVMQSNRFENDT
jgi:hypothetical protein